MATTPRQVVVSSRGAFPSKDNKGNKDAAAFWNENPRGVPLEALFGNAGGAGEIGARLRTHDISGDGYLDKTEFRNAIMGEISAVKSAKQLKIVAAVLIGLVVVLCAAMTGLTFVVVDLSKDTTPSTTGVMEVKNSARTLPNGNVVPVTMKTGEIEQVQQPLSSCMPDSYFKEMKQFSIESGLTKMAIAVDGYVRLPRPNSVHGTVVVLITPIGRITLDAQGIEFESNVGDILKEAGFTVDAGGRRLHGLYELSAFFNAIPEENFSCFNTEKDGAKPSFPTTYSADVTIMYNCDPRAQDAETQGNGTSSRCETTLPAGLKSVQLYGETVQFAIGYSKTYVDLKNKRSREEWHFPGRMDKWGLVKIMTIAEGSKWFDAMQLSRNAATGALDAKQGFYCDRRESKGQDEISMLPDEAQVAYEGEHTTDDGRKGRSFTFIKSHKSEDGNTQAFLYRFKDAWTPASGTDEDADDYLDARYVMYEIELWDLNKNIILMMYQLKNIDVMWRAKSDSDLWKKPYDCYTLPQEDGPSLEKGSFLATALPYGDADWSKIEAMKYFMKTQEGMLVNQNTGEFETVTTANGTKTSRRRLLGYEVDTDGTQYRTTHGRKLLGNTCCKYYYDGQKTGAANEFSLAADAGMISVGVDFGFVFASGEPGDKTFSALPIGANTCAISISVNINLAASGLPLYIEGNVYADWKPPMKFDECWEVGGCLTIGLGIKKGSFDITLVSATLCFLGGKYEVNGCMRSYLAISIGAGVSIMADTKIGKFGIGVSGTVYFKWFLPNDKCENINENGVDEGYKANQLDFDPYFQLDWELCFFICYTDSWAKHFFGPEPGRMVRKYHDYPVDIPDLPDGVLDGVTTVTWNDGADPINKKAGLMGTSFPLAGFVREASTSGKTRDGDLSNLIAGVQMNFAQNLGYYEDDGITPEAMQTYACRTVNVDFGGDYGLIGKKRKGWAKCGDDEWAFGFERDGPKANYKTVEREDPNKNECNCAIKRRCDKQKGRCRWSPRKYDEQVLDYYSHPINLIKRWKCCKIRIPSNKVNIVPRNCKDEGIKADMKRSEGYAQCKNSKAGDPPRAATGMWRDRDKKLGVACGEDELGCIEKLTCCEGAEQPY
ncbi:hypothetical protein RI054_42g150340 [Pseudoscourfieldia marina]